MEFHFIFLFWEVRTQTITVYHAFDARD
uniref:Uncharacterized protein n=1 Tax=Arundo donax TaxID=35708 RepID=A0A0A9F0H2_ARUDO